MTERILQVIVDASGVNVMVAIVMPSRVYRVVGFERSSSHHYDPLDQGRYVERWLRGENRGSR